LIGRAKPDRDLDFDIDMALPAVSAPCAGVDAENGLGPRNADDLDPGPDPGIPLDTPRNEFEYFLTEGYLESIGETADPNTTGKKLAGLSPTGSL